MWKEDIRLRFIRQVGNAVIYLRTDGRHEAAQEFYRSRDGELSGPYVSEVEAAS